MDTQTQQFVYRLSAIVLGVAVLGSLAFLCAVALSQGDGEAVSVANTLTPWLLGTLAALVVALLGHQGAAALVAKYAAQAAQSVASGPPAPPAPVAPVAAPVPTAAPQASPQPLPYAAAPVVPAVALPAGGGSAA